MDPVTAIENDVARINRESDERASAALPKSIPLTPVVAATAPEAPKSDVKVARKPRASVDIGAEAEGRCAALEQAAREAEARADKLEQDAREARTAATIARLDATAARKDAVNGALAAKRRDENAKRRAALLAELAKLDAEASK